MLETKFQPFPVLPTERLLLRELTANDTARIFALRSNEKVMFYIDRPHAKTEEDALAYINSILTASQNNSGITWGICFKDDETLLGTIGFWRIEKEHYRAEIGYMLDDAFQRRGIMQEAITAALDYAFYAMHLHSVEANVNPANVASIKILEKNNFVHEAHFRENYYYNGKFIDSFVFSLLGSDHKR
jgi:ribosomal-protein-alanine N-acetyltransferase